METEFYERKEFLKREFGSNDQWKKYLGWSFDKWFQKKSGRFWATEKTKPMLEEIWNEMSTPDVKEGDHATHVYYSDRRAGTVVSVERVKSGKNKGRIKRLGVGFNKVVCNDYYSGDYQILDELDGDVTYYTLRSNGNWVSEGTSSKDWGTLLSLGKRDHYIDPEF